MTFGRMLSGQVERITARFGLTMKSLFAKGNCRFRFLGNIRLKNGDIVRVRERDICEWGAKISRPPGEMASRLTTNQEIAGSTPAVVINIFYLFSLFGLGDSSVGQIGASRRPIHFFSPYSIVLSKAKRRDGGEKRPALFSGSPLLMLFTTMRLTQVYHLSHRSLSTVQRGTAFENRALDLLTEHMSMSLTRVGGSYDGGIDLIGWWWLPHAQSSTTTCTYHVLFSLLPLKPLSKRVTFLRASNTICPFLFCQILSMPLQSRPKAAGT
jgi:hypothetical protein